MVRLLTQSLKIVSILVMAIVVAGGSVWFFDYVQNRERSENVGRPVTVEITDEDSTASVAEKLSDSELIEYDVYFETRMRFSGNELRPGIYTLRIGMSVPDIIDVITVPQTASADAAGEGEAEDASAASYQVTFIEGQRAEQNGAVLEEAGMAGAQANYMSSVMDVDSWRGNYAFLDSVPSGASLEGFLFPDTYVVGGNAGAADVVGLQLSTFEANFTSEMRVQADAQGLSIYEVVTIASIVEREAAIPEERPQIAAVYLNRIEQDMRLEADPTVQYAVGTEAEWWPTLNTELLEQSANSPYNTYLNEGLPPGPIANAGFASLQAVLQPAEVDYLFFVTTGDDTGAHVFANTYEEHLINTCEQHPEYEECGGGGSSPLPSPYADTNRWTRERIG